MKKSKLLTMLVALLAMAVPAMAVFTGMGLDSTLSNLRRLHFPGPDHSGVVVFPVCT